MKLVNARNFLQQSKTVVLIALMCFTFAAEGQDRIAFATTYKGTGDLSTWPSVGASLSGLEAADSICVAEATNADLPNAGNFVAWLSAAGIDAFCRVQGLTGTRSTNCGLTVLANDAGPWVRTDGTPAAVAFRDLPGGRLEFYSPLLFDASGNAINNGGLAWATSGPVGEFNNVFEDCSGWTTTEGTARTTDLAAVRWDVFGAASCTFSAHLMCVEKLAGPDLNLPEVSSNVAFVTDVRGNGEFSTWEDATPGTEGIEAADSICNNRAADAGLPWVGTYKAWLSDSSVNAKDRITGPGPWVRPDGIPVALNTEQFASGALFSAFNLTDQGDYLSNTGVWTGTNSGGTANASHCNDWTSSDSGSGRAGRAMWSNSIWTDRDTTACSSALGYLYCLSDVGPTIYQDGFEAPEPTQ